MSIEIHQGRVISDYVYSKGINISWLSNQMNISRRTIYNTFSKEVVPNNFLNSIQKLLNHNFEFNNYGDSIVKTYTIQVIQNTITGQIEIKRHNKNFNFHELIGILETAKQDVLDSLAKQKIIIKNE